MPTVPESTLEAKVPEDMIASFFSTQSEPSSTPSLPDERVAEDRIARYHPRDNEDRTWDVLSSFVRFLPVEGRQALAEFITTLDDAKLYGLYSHLMTCILVPSESTIFGAIFAYRTVSEL